MEKVLCSTNLPLWRRKLTSNWFHTLILTSLWAIFNRYWMVPTAAYLIKLLRNKARVVNKNNLLTYPTYKIISRLPTISWVMVLIRLHLFTDFDPVISIKTEPSNRSIGTWLIILNEFKIKKNLPPITHRSISKPCDKM